MMDSARWERIQAIFHAAADLPGAERPAYLKSVCGEDSGLLAAVTGMLREDNDAASLLDHGLPEIAYRMVGGRSESVSVRTVGPYRLQRILGEGGMGVVWLAQREDTGNLVAIKFLPHASLSPARRERFAREIKTLAKLKHPYIARLYDAGTLPDGTPWFVMEYVEGLQFAEYCRKHDGSLEERVGLFRKICEAVQYAHGQEIIHRDLKPSNIIVEKDGAPRLLDFGIARELQTLDEPGEQTRAGLRFLSPDYAAPEWVRDGSVGFYTDVYSLGVILYEILTGRVPARTAGDQRPENPSIAGRACFPDIHGAAWADLDVLCLKAMHSDAAARYQSVEALIRDIDHYLSGRPLEARPDTQRYRVEKFVRRNRAAVLSSAAVVAVIAGLVAFFTLRLKAERDYANRETAIATSMNRFLSEDLLGRSDPFRSGKAQELFVDVVARSAAQIDTSFSQEPVVAARLHAILAKAFENRSDYARARIEYEKAHDLFLRGEGTGSQDAILVRLEQAAMEASRYESGSQALAKSLLNEAEKSLAGVRLPRPDLVVTDLTARGVIAIQGNDPQTAERDFSAAVERARAIPGYDARRVSIERNLVAAYVHRNDGVKAEPLAREIIATLTATQGPESPETLWARAYLAQALFVQHKFAAAIAEANRVYPALVRSVGEDQRITMTILGTRAAAEGSLALWDAAIRDDLALYDLASRKHSGPSLFTVGMLSDAALSQCRSGRLAEGEPNARKAYVQAKGGFGTNAPLTLGASYTLAVCLTGEGKLDEAWKLLQSMDAKTVSQLSGDAAAGADIALAKADIAFRRHDYNLARRYVDAAAPTLDRDDADVWQRQSLNKLRRAIPSP